MTVDALVLPGVPVPYHYGGDMLNGLLAPPFGPNLEFSEEVVGVYAWISLFLIVVTVLLRRAARRPLMIRGVA